jgi:ATPase family associated with various cellular activities (AAA)
MSDKVIYYWETSDYNKWNMITSSIMDIAEALKITDDLIFDSTSKYLDNLQRSIVQGVWEGKTYKNIADSIDRTEGHIRDSAANLWQDISEVIGENVRKSNFKSVVERYQISIVSSHNYKDKIQIRDINFHLDLTSIGQEIRRNLNLDQDRDSIKIDVGDAIPDLFPFYSRDLELTKLKQWVIEDKCRLINIFGVNGIGKTALVSQLATQLRAKFECVIWQSLRSKRPLFDLIDRDILPSLPIQIIADTHHDLETRISLLIEQLSKHRCLIILDNIHRIFNSNNLAGTYNDEGKEYQNLFRRISESNHQSCLVLIGREQPREFVLLDRSIRTLALDGLDLGSQQQILKDSGITNSDRWIKEIAYYAGNPLYLNVVATTIKDLFDGRIDDFCQDRRLFLTNDMKLILQRQYDRLSAIEQQVLQEIASQDRSISLAELIVSSQIAPSDLLEALQSLGRRQLIHKQKTEIGVLFDLQPILKEFILLLIDN